MLKKLAEFRDWLTGTPHDTPGMIFTPASVGPSPLVVSPNEEKAITFVTETIAALYEALTAMSEVQRTVLIDLGQNVDARFQISVQIAQQFYKEGAGELTAASLQKLGSEAQLQALVWQYFCNASAKQLEQSALAAVLESVDGRARFGLPPRGPAARQPNRYRSAQHASLS